MQKQKMYNRQKKPILLITCLFSLFFLHHTAFSEIEVIQGKKGSGFYIQDGGDFSFNKINVDERCDEKEFTIVNTGDTPVEFAGEKITLVNADDSAELDFTLTIDELTDYIQPGDDTKFTLQFITDATDGMLKKALVTLSFAGEDQPFTFYVSCVAKTKVMYEFPEVGKHYWESPGHGTAGITLVGAGGGGGGGAGSEGGKTEGNGGKGGRAGIILINSPIFPSSTVLTIEIGNGGSGGYGDVDCGESGGNGSPGGPSIIYHENSPLFTANGGAGGRGGSGIGDRHGTSGQNGYNNAPGGSPGSTSAESGGPGGQGAPTAGGGGGAGAKHSEGGHCYPDSGRGGNGGCGYCKIEWIGFLE